jgi:hypothetical protein
MDIQVQQGVRCESFLILSPFKRPIRRALRCADCERQVKR